MAVDFAIIGSLVRPGRPRYPVLVHRAATLLHAFFRPHLAMMPLRFANPSPPSGWIEDFHLQAVVQYSAHQEYGSAYAPPCFQMGMPSFLALSARFAEMPEPGNTMTPIGRTSRIRSLRLNGAALA